MAYSKDEIKTLFDTIIERIEEGNSLRAILRGDNNMPSRSLFFKWIHSDDVKQNRYACACEARADVIFDDIFDISDNVGDDIIILPDGREVVDNAVIARDRLRVDARKWALSKMNPKKYGDKVENNNINTNINIDLNEEQKKEALDTIKKSLNEFKDYE